MRDKETYRYHTTYLGKRDDERAKSARKHVLELSQEEQDMEDAASDIIEAMEDEIDSVLDPVTDYSDQVDRGNR